MINFQMDNVLGLHGLVGGKKYEGGNTPLGRFKNKGIWFVKDEAVQSLLRYDNQYIAIGNEGILFSLPSDNKVYYMYLDNNSTLVAKDNITDIRRTGDTIQLFAVEKGFVGIYQTSNSTSTNVQYNIKLYDHQGNYKKMYTTSVDESTYSNSHLTKVMQDPITKDYVLLFQYSGSSTPSYLVVLNEAFQLQNSTYIDNKYSINTKWRSHMAYDGWIYGISFVNYSQYVKFMYTKNDLPNNGFASVSTQNPQSVVADPKMKLAYDITNGFMLRTDILSLFSRTVPLQHHSSDVDTPYCINSSPNPEKGLIVAGDKWEVFEINFRTPKTYPSQFAPAPEARQITEIERHSFDYFKFLISNDCRNMLFIEYKKDTNMTSNVYLYRR
ncbi:hypothetical protein [Clostridium botulinum]|uniref:hypothetical protein n=1 Tax=Clostridium botulinum TaxID=1491 RepID=UPI000A1761E5|nr:hypothetical protein [Clostridium botulinum]AUN11431.1 hypothetical protein RSJ6_13345 [Clostridium botulinum]OSA67663.1 hypothetical protein B2H87_17370 [Clostridium botulinum]